MQLVGPCSAAPAAFPGVVSNRKGSVGDGRQRPSSEPRMCCGRAQPYVQTAKWQSAQVPGRECLYLRLPGRHSTQPGCSDGLPLRMRQQVELRGPLGPIRSLAAKQGHVLRSRVTSARSRSAARSSLITPPSRPGRSSLLRPAGRAAPPSSAQPAGPLPPPPRRRHEEGAMFTAAGLRLSRLDHDLFRC